MKEENKLITEEGKKAVKILKRHILFLCSNDKYNAMMLTDWLTHQIQNPGKLVGWAVLIQSIPGAGKSYLGKLLSACLGDVNIATVRSGDLSSQFNGWIAGKLVTVIEELKITGRDKHKINNALERMITNEQIMLNETGKPKYSIKNTANILGLTNDKDSLPLPDDDKHWFVLWVDLYSLEEMELLTGLDADTYFDRLFDTLKEATQLRRWFSHREINSEFKKAKTAPHTTFKEDMYINTYE